MLTEKEKSVILHLEDKEKEKPMRNEIDILENETDRLDFSPETLRIDAVIDNDHDAHAVHLSPEFDEAVASVNSFDVDMGW